VGRALLAAPDPVTWVERARAALQACP